MYSAALHRKLDIMDFCLTQVTGGAEIGRAPRLVIDAIMFLSAPPVPFILPASVHMLVPIREPPAVLEVVASCVTLGSQKHWCVDTLFETGVRFGEAGMRWERGESRFEGKFSEDAAAAISQDQLCEWRKRAEFISSFLAHTFHQSESFSWNRPPPPFPVPSLGFSRWLLIKRWSPQTQQG